MLLKRGIHANRDPSTIPAFLRTLHSSSSGVSRVSSPQTQTVPSVGRSSALISFTMVDFPEPL